MEQSEQVSMEDMKIELPPLMQQFVEELKGDRKKLLRTEDYSRPDQLRAFIGQFMYPRLIQMFEMLGAAGLDTYGLAVSNATQGQRLHAFVVRELQNMGSDLDSEESLPGVSTEVLEEFQQAFYALGALLQEKLPEDKKAEKVFNNCARLMGEMVAQLMGYEAYDEEDDDDDRDGGSSDDVEDPSATPIAQADDPESESGSEPSSDESNEAPAEDPPAEAAEATPTQEA